MLSAWFLQERVTALDWLTILLVLSGMGVFFFERLTVEGFWGNICAIVGGMAFAWVVLCLRKQKGVSPLQTVLLGNILAAVAGLPFMFESMPEPVELDCPRPLWHVADRARVCPVRRGYSQRQRPRSDLDSDDRATAQSSVGIPGGWREAQSCGRLLVDRS